MWAAFAVGLALCASLTGGAPARAAAPASRPVLVELFTSQGCSSCPDANRFVAELAERRGVMALTFPVDYWDYLGWSDTFAQPEFTTRQRAYQSRFKLKEIYTPEIIVGGAEESAGSDRERVEKLIKAETARTHLGPRVRVQRNGTRIVLGDGSFPRGGLEVWLVRYDPSRREVKVDRGENRGRSVVHKNVVRELVRLGTWSGQARSYAVPAPKSDDLKFLVILQAPRGGPVWSLGRN